MCEEGSGRWAVELSEGRGELEEAREGVSPGLARTLAPGGVLLHPSPPPASQPGHQIWGWASGLSDLLPPRSCALGPALGPGSVLGNSARCGEGQPPGQPQASLGRGGHSRCRCTRG